MRLCPNVRLDPGFALALIPVGSLLQASLHGKNRGGVKEWECRGTAALRSAELFRDRNILGTEKMRLIARLCATVLITSSSLAIAAPGGDGLDGLDLTKGIWAISHDRELAGQKPEHFPERLMACDNPAVKMQHDMASLKKMGCNVKLITQTETEIGYAATCPPYPGASQSLQFKIETTSPQQFKATTTSKEARNVMTGRWVRDCP
jgi:hypothetical protein